MTHRPLPTRLRRHAYPLHPIPCSLDPLESRILLSLAANLPPLIPAHPKPISPSTPVAHHTFAISKISAAPHALTPPGTALSPQQVRAAYGLPNLSFGNTPADGTGQTIAIVIAYHYPTAFADLQAFDAFYGLADPPSFTQVSQTGSTTAFPPTDPAGAGNANGTWELEAALDLQWSHTIAPGANLVLVETNSSSLTDMFAGVAFARTLPNVSVVSMSWGAGEFSSEAAHDTNFTTPATHQGVTFVASTGDDGDPAGYPAYSPNVVAVGGTSLTMSGTTLLSETGWSGSGGGISTFESKPAYQSSISLSATRRTAPDISLLADPNTGVGLYDGWDYGGWAPFQIGGTSLAAPLFSGMMAIVNQGRALAGLPSLDGPSQTLPALYNLPAADIRDILTGNNGNAAAPGYDLVTGRGAPIADLFIPDLGNFGIASGTSFVDRNSNTSQDPGEPGLPGQTVFLDANHNGLLDPAASTTLPSGTLNLAIPDNNSAGLTSTLSFSALTGPITDVNLSLKISHTRDSDLTAYLIAPDGTQITLFSGVGGSGDNFNTATFDDSASLAITSGAAPFNNTYRPANRLSAFIGHNAAGAWKLKIVDGRASTTGTLNLWSLAITTAPEISDLTAADGAWSLAALQGATTLQTTPPMDYIPTNTTSRPLTLDGITAPQSFGNFPTLFSTANPADLYYLWLDPSQTTLMIGTTDSPTAPLYSTPLAALPSLRFNLLAPGSKLIVDFVNGSPFPATGLLVDGASAPNTELSVKGQSPSQQLTMTDTTLAPAGGPAITYQNLSGLSLQSATVLFTGTLNTLEYLNINTATTFYFMG